MNLPTNKVKLLFLLLLFFPVLFGSGLDSVQLEWKVEVGDSITWLLATYYDLLDSDADGDIYTRTFEICNTYGTPINITWKNGSQVKFTISELPPLANAFAMGSRTFDGKVTEEPMPSSIVRQTIDNRTYWEEYAVTVSPESRVEENLLIIVREQFLSPVNVFVRDVMKIDWQTGWVVYQYQKLYNDSTVLSEGEFIQITPSNSDWISGFNFPLLMSGVGSMVVILRKQRSKSS